MDDEPEIVLGFDSPLPVDPDLALKERLDRGELAALLEPRLAEMLDAGFGEEWWPDVCDRCIVTLLAVLGGALPADARVAALEDWRCEVARGYPLPGAWGEWMDRVRLGAGEIDGVMEMTLRSNEQMVSLPAAHVLVRQLALRLPPQVTREVEQALAAREVLERWPSM
ncbi:MAG: hypothetical protein EOO74_01590 [Myxococcales bacterium]|nr:MAG: hypothetical protein EOO74_01590 [Myxococcales bacterium]